MPDDEKIDEKPANAGGTSADTFTKAQVEDLVADRLRRDRRVQKTDFLKQIGFEGETAETDLQSLIQFAKTAQEDKRKAEEQSKTDLQKAQDAVALKDKEIVTLKDAHQQEVKRWEKRVIDAAIRLEASKPVMGEDEKKQPIVKRPAFLSDALEDVVTLIERDEIKLEGDAVVGVEKALEKLAEKKKFLLAGEATAEKGKGTPVPSTKPKPPTETVERKSQPSPVQL